MIRLHAVWDCIKYFPAQDLFLYSDLSDPHSNLSEFLPTTLTREDGCPVHWMGVIRLTNTYWPGHVWVISLINILRPLDISKWICQNIIIFVMLGLYWHVYTSPGQLEIFIFIPSWAMQSRTLQLLSIKDSWAGSRHLKDYNLCDNQTNTQWGSASSLVSGFI